MALLEAEKEAQEETIEVQRSRERAMLVQGLEEALENDMMALRLTHKRQVRESGFASAWPHFEILQSVIACCWQVALEDEKLQLKYGQVHVRGR